MTTIKDRDRLARRVADQTAKLEGARAELATAEESWRAAVASDGDVTAAATARARAHAKVAELAEVAEQLGLLLADADAELAHQRALAEHKAAIEQHRRAVAEREAMPLPDVEAAIAAVLGVADALRARVAAIRAASDAEQAAATHVMATAMAAGVEAPELLAVDPLASAPADLPAEWWVQRVWSAATQYTRRDTAERLGEAAGMIASEQQHAAQAPVESRRWFPNVPNLVPSESPDYVLNP
ncbi:MAG TPA: hypothetical protein VFM74_02590 [Candidatus Limnocylindria bacterium]|nr:hypothetical protein [Candidatus Limnocylindria bacterium]